MDVETLTNHMRLAHTESRQLRRKPNRATKATSAGIVAKAKSLKDQRKERSIVVALVTTLRRTHPRAPRRLRIFCKGDQTPLTKESHRESGARQTSSGQGESNEVTRPLPR